MIYRVCLVAQSCPTLCGPVDCNLPDSSVHGDSPGKNTGVGYHVLFQGIFPTQESNLHLQHCRQSLYFWDTREAISRCFKFKSWQQFGWVFLLFPMIQDFWNAMGKAENLAISQIWAPIGTSHVPHCLCWDTRKVIPNQKGHLLCQYEHGCS